MTARCTYPSQPHYRYYGGRGITVCDRWAGKDGFINFLTDMGERPAGMTLDRVDRNGNYEPANCRWATWSQQRANQAPPRYSDSRVGQCVVCDKPLVQQPNGRPRLYCSRFCKRRAPAPVHRFRPDLIEAWELKPDSLDSTETRV